MVIKMNFISKRIKTVSSFIKPFTRIADVGCDHGYLIIEAFLQQNITFAQAIDNKEAPLLSAKENIQGYDFFNNVVFTLSDGIKDLDKQVEVLIIAGIGGLNIIEILTANPSKLHNIKRIILQPNRNLYEVRKWALENNWEISNETILEENNIFYEILVLAKSTEPLSYSEKELLFGPVLIQNKGEIFIKKWQEINQNYERLIENLDENLDRVKALKSQTILIKELINENKECY